MLFFLIAFAWVCHRRRKAARDTSGSGADSKRELPHAYRNALASEGAGHLTTPRSGLVRHRSLATAPIAEDQVMMLTEQAKGVFDQETVDLDRRDRAPDSFMLALERQRAHTTISNHGTVGTSTGPNVSSFNTPYDSSRNTHSGSGIGTGTGHHGSTARGTGTDMGTGTGSGPDASRMQTANRGSPAEDTMTTQVCRNAACCVAVSAETHKHS